MRSRSMPTPLVVFAWGSASMSSVFRSAAASEAARFTAVVVLPTPPFWFAIAITRDMVSSYLTISYIVGKFSRVQYTFVSRETKERKFHVKLQQWGQATLRRQRVASRTRLWRSLGVTPG